MAEETQVALAEVVESRLAVRRREETVLGAFAVAGKEELALAALAREGGLFGLAESPLPLAVHHRGERFRADIPQPVFGEDEVVAAVNIAVIFHHARVPAGLGHGAESRRDAEPVGERRVEKLYIVVAYVVLHPFVEDGAEEVAPLPWRDGEGRERRRLFAGRGEARAVGVAAEPLHDGGELDVAATDGLEETVEFEGEVGVVVIDNRHRVVFDAVLLQQLDALHHLVERRAALAVAAIFVVELRRPVDGEADEEAVVAEEAAPVVVEERAVRLNRIGDAPPPGVFRLELQGFAVEADGAHQGFAAVPGEEDLRRRLGFEILADEKLQQLVGEDAVRVVGVEPVLFQIIAILAGEVAERARRFRHHVERARERGESRHA